MPRIGNVVDAETAHRIVTALKRLPNCDFRNQLRPVIWPEQKAAQANKTTIPIEELDVFTPIKRVLIHLVCEEDQILGIFVNPGSLYDFYCIEIAGFEFPYEIPDKGQFPVNQLYHFLYVDCHKHEWTKPEAVGMSFGSVANVITGDDYDKDEDALGIFTGAGKLEHFAFSPLTTTKLKPTRRHLNNPIEHPRQFAPLEVVNLRLPEKIDHPESTGRTINLRYPVISHPRRIKDKGTGEVRIIQVSEHWRGPKDAPVKPIIPKVYKVTR